MNNITSKVYYGDGKKTSVKTTIPQTVRTVLDLNKGDTVKWEIIPQGNSFRIKVEKDE